MKFNFDKRHCLTPTWKVFRYPVNTLILTGIVEGCEQGRLCEVSLHPQICSHEAIPVLFNRLQHCKSMAKIIAIDTPYKKGPAPTSDKNQHFSCSLSLPFSMRISYPPKPKDRSKSNHVQNGFDLAGHDPRWPASLTAVASAAECPFLQLNPCRTQPKLARESPTNPSSFKDPCFVAEAKKRTQGTICAESDSIIVWLVEREREGPMSTGSLNFQQFCFAAFFVVVGEGAPLAPAATADS